MQPDSDKIALEKACVVLEKRTSLGFALLATLIFLFLGVVLELIVMIVFGKITLPQAVQAYRWPKLFLMAIVFFPLYYYGIMHKDRQLLLQ